MYCWHRGWTILLTTREKSGCIASTENGLFYLPLEGSLDVLPTQRMDYSIYHWREVRMHCRYREWTILLTTGGKSGCIVGTENGLFYLPLEGSQDVFLAQRMDEIEGDDEDFDVVNAVESEDSSDSVHC